MEREEYEKKIYLSAKQLVELYENKNVDANELRNKTIRDLYERVYNGDYKQRNILNNSKQDCYYSGYLDCFDKLTK